MYFFRFDDDDLDDIEDEPLDEVNADEDQEQIDVLPAPDQAQRVEPTERMTTPYMSKYEKARVLGTRALQIA